MKYMLDTNICIDLIRNRSVPALQALNQHIVSDIGISAITAAELQYGVHRSSMPDQNEQALEHFLAPLRILDFDYNAAASYGQLRANLERQGTVIGALDMLIAAHALGLGLTVITNNTREFARVPGLTVEDWTAS
jgi:tRNA(fMet)-specific endonuclease VapC